MHVLLVEPNYKRGKHLQSVLHRVLYEADVLSTASAALTRLETRSHDYDAVIVNATELDEDPEAWCKSIRASNIDLPIIAITPEGDDNLAIRMLLQYVDDYVRLPVKALELVARLQAVTRRPKKIEETSIALGSLEVDITYRCVRYQNEEIILTKKEFMIIEYLAQRPNRIVERSDLISHIWEIPDATLSNTLDAHIKNLRRKLMKAADCGIETIRGHGYRLVVYNNTSLTFDS